MTQTLSCTLRATTNQHVPVWPVTCLHWRDGLCDRCEPTVTSSHDSQPCSRRTNRTDESTRFTSGWDNICRWVENRRQCDLIWQDSLKPPSLPLQVRSLTTLQPPVLSHRSAATQIPFDAAAETTEPNRSATLRPRMSFKLERWRYSGLRDATAQEVVRLLPWSHLV